MSPSLLIILLALLSLLYLLLLILGISKLRRDLRHCPISISAGEIPVIVYIVILYCSRKHDARTSMDFFINLICLKSLHKSIQSRMVWCQCDEVDAILFGETLELLTGEHGAIIKY